MLLDQEQKQKAPEATSPQQESPEVPESVMKIKALYGNTPPPRDEMSAILQAERSPKTRKQLVDHIQSTYGNTYARGISPIAPDIEAEPEDQGNIPKEAEAKEAKVKSLTLADLDQPPVGNKRSKEEMEDDLKCVYRILELITAKSKTTTEIEAYFPKIIKRYDLTSLAFGNEDGKVFIDAKINPEIKFYDLRDISLQDQIDLKTVSDLDPDVPNYETETIKDKVGTKMEVYLTPKHPAGSSPKSGEQTTLFAQLPTKGKVSKATRTGTNIYIKGHLLNDNLGGPGEAKNLFPITHQANVDHETTIESDAKKMVNNNGLHAHYCVEVKHEGLTGAKWDDLDPFNPTNPKKSINATFTCTLSAIVLDEGKPHPKIVKKAIIHSEYESKSTPENAASSDFDPETDDQNLGRNQPHDPKDVHLPPRSYHNISALSQAAKDYLSEFSDTDDLKNELLSIKSLGRDRIDIILDIHEHGENPDLEKQDKRQQTTAINTLNKFVELNHELQQLIGKKRSELEKLIERKEEKYESEDFQMRVKKVWLKFDEAIEVAEEGIKKKDKDWIDLNNILKDVRQHNIFTPTPSKSKSELAKIFDPETPYRVPKKSKKKKLEIPSEKTSRRKVEDQHFTKQEQNEEPEQDEESEEEQEKDED